MYIIPTIHPAYLLHQAKPISEVIRKDLAKANRVSLEGPKQYENIVVVHPSNPAGLEAAVEIGKSWLIRWKNLRCPVSIDVETSSLQYFNCKLYSIAIAGEDGCNTAVTFTLCDLKTLPWDAELAMLGCLRDLLADENISKVFHNAPYDLAVLTRKGFVLAGRIEDTQALAHLVQPDIPKDLGWVGHTYLDVEPWKLNHETGKKKAFTKDIIELLVYNGKDALNTIKLRQPLIADVLNRGMTHELIHWQNAFAWLATRMELAGLPVNREKRKAMGNKLLGALEELKHRMRTYLNWSDFNPMNKRHAVIALYDRKYLGLVPTVFTEKTKQPSTKYEDLIDHMEHPFVKDLITFIENRHVYATQYRDISGKKGEKPGAYYRAFQEDGRMHPQWNSCGTKGSRFSSQPNCQNQRIEDREFFEAPEGRIFVGADKAQLELRLVAVFSGAEELLVEMRKPDGDPHTMAAINVYGDKFLSLPKDERKKLRDGVKTTVYACIYRGGIKTVHKTVRKSKKLKPNVRAALTLKEVARIYNSFFGKFVEIPAWHDRNFELASTRGFLEIPPFNRRRYFPVQPPVYTEVASWPVQTPGSDYVGKEMVLIQEELDQRYKGSAFIVIHGQDALAAECEIRHADEVAEIVQRHFGATKVEGPAGPLLLTADVKIGKTLKDVK